jgi:hypothetical protein
MRIYSLRLRVPLGAAVLLLATTAAYAQQREDLREAAQNPIADFISLPFRTLTSGIPTTRRTS